MTHVAIETAAGTRGGRIWSVRIGYGLLAIVTLFLLAGSVAPKLLGLSAATETLTSLGWSPESALPIGIIELICVVLLVFPRTRVLGAVLTTGLLGGAMATQMRVSNPLFSHILFGLYVGGLMWLGLWLTDPRVRALLPFGKRAAF